MVVMTDRPRAEGIGRRFKYIRDIMGYIWDIYIYIYLYIYICIPWPIYLIHIPTQLIC